MKQESSLLAKLANGSLVLQILLGIAAGLFLLAFHRMRLSKLHF